MTALMFGVISQAVVPADEAVIRNTAVPVDHNAPAAEQASAPDPNEVETDSNPNLGMVNRQLASDWTEGTTSVPPWLGEVDASTEHNAIIDRQVSTSGHAAALEAAGVWGHGSLSYAQGIEPVGDLTGAGGFGNVYFAAGKPDIQSTMGSEMEVAPGYDRTIPGLVAATSKVDSRAAAQSSAYDVWYQGVAG